MKTRPRELLFLALLLTIVAASFPLQIMAQFGDPIWEPEGILLKLTPLNYAVIVLALLEAYLLREASPFLRYVAPAFLLAVIWNNWLVASLSPPGFAVFAWASSGAAIAIHGLMFFGNARRVLIRPNLRWWRTAMRRKLSAQAILLPTDGGELISQTIDISEGGLFIATPKAATLTSRGPTKRLRIGAYCVVKLKLGKGATFSCTATVVRRSAAKGSYPAGLGLSFTPMSAEEKRYFESFLNVAIPKNESYALT